MDEDTENRLNGILKRLISRYSSMDDKLAALDKDVALIRKDMREAAILLRDKHTWRLEEIDSEIKAFADKLEKNGGTSG